ncbi:MAG: hypothetical protein Q4D60_01395 [Eubacteriales bacterium]|nr:hypothetical protein [Eubacteriales bacterium]
MKTLYLHIGTPKTGTTSLQHFCTENAELLQEKGYCYPIFPHKFRQTNIMRNAFFLSVKCYDENREADLVEEERMFRQGMDFVIDTFRKYDKVILSDEAIWNVVFRRGKDDLWTKLRKEAEKNNFTIKVIVYFRRQDSLAISWWKQKIKVGQRLYSRTTWENFIENSSRLEMNYYEPLKVIEKEIGQENIIVRRFGREYFKNGSIFEDFLDAIGLKYSSKFVITEEQRNTALVGNTPEIKRILNGIPGLTHRDNVFFRRILVGMSDETPELNKKTLFSSEEAQQFMERYKDGNRKVMKEYFGKDEDLFRMDFSNYDKWIQTEEEMEKDIIRFTGKALINLRNENTELKKQVNELEEVLSEQRREIEEMKQKLDNPLGNIMSSLKRKKRK